MIPLIDTHCHLTFPPLSDSIEGVLERSIAAGVKQWITIGTDVSQSEACVALARRQESMWATVGVHPHEAKGWTQAGGHALRELASDPVVCAIGEIGLDYHYDFSSPKQQQEVFAAQLGWAAEVQLPVVVHTREAFDDTMSILAQYSGSLPGVVLHCFTGTAEQARYALACGYYLSFTGAVTFRNAQAIREAARQVPLDRLMIETDCPYMSPEPVRKQRPNEPALLIHTARFLADFFEMDFQEFCKKVTDTSCKFFGLQ